MVKTGKNGILDGLSEACCQGIIMSAEKKSDSTVSFKDTLNLPRTDFPIRSNPQVDDPAMIERWKNEDIYNKTFEAHQGKTKFILHDGPPYANGHTHIGHAYNKILKDIVTKSQRMLGKQVPVTPGWDCHGLPIEIKVTQNDPKLSRSQLKKACRDYANHWIAIQKEEFRRLGVFMQWDHPYLTMDFAYEADTLRAFGRFVEDGYIARKNKTVPWCFNCQTVLASAEIEYEERKDPSIYVLFALEQALTDKLFPALQGKTVNAIIWTTTPWTLPLNRAVLIKPKTTYVVVDLNGTYGFVAEQLADALCSFLNTEKKIVGSVIAEDLEQYGPRVEHPLIPDYFVPIILDQSVLINEGTALVHCAPGAGPEDYEVGVKNNLEIYSPISVDGKYTQLTMPPALIGQSVTDGQIWVIKRLAEVHKLLYKTSIRHSYPHCWRCHNGLIFRATKQWFCDLSQHNLKERVLAAIKDIQAVPEASANRLKATVEGRLEWCLSRQRVWGVPIPALLCTNCDYTYITHEFVRRVADAVEKEGIEYWDTVAVEKLVLQSFQCPVCSNTTFVKEQDILDVWFDSGISHYAVLRKIAALQFPADMYLEGKDQHRGWFQSSLLTSMVLEGKSCVKTIMTHGYTVDAQGKKMSKSLGNVVSPVQMMESLGTDGLRLWASSIDASGDVVVSDTLTKNVQEVLRKIRNTLRFLLSNLYDFSFEKDALALNQLTLLDQHALQDLLVVNKKIIDAYNAYDFTLIFHILSDYCAVNLSAFYLDIVKDRLYVEQADGHARRSAQTACWYILDTLTKLMAPILSFTAEQVTDLYQENKNESIHLQTFADVTSLEKVVAYNAEQVAAPWWQTVKQVRSALLKAIEDQREQGVIKHSLEAQVTVAWEELISKQLGTLHDELEQKQMTLEAFLKELLIVSKVTLVKNHANLAQTNLAGVWASVTHADGDKCPRCWQWDVTNDEHKLCNRCQRVLRK